MKKIKNINIIALSLALLLLVAGCSKIDAYKSQYQSTESIIYAGQMDSVKIYSGRYRVKLVGLFTSDPNIVKYRVYTNSGLDSLEVAVKRTSGVDTARTIIPNLQEGAQTFQIKTFDNKGNSSVPFFTTATVYGANYQASLLNRGIVSAAMVTNTSALITWADVSSAAGMQYMEIQYLNANNVQKDTIVTAALQGQTTSLPSFKLGTPISYRTAFLPNPTAIDTFYVTFQPHNVKAEVTSIYFSNMGPSFARNTFDGRWGTLAAPWVTNAAAKNKDAGVNGGYSSDGGGVINWETWGNTPVVDGIVYQPTNAALPAGNYTVSFDEYSEVQSNSSVYCVVAAGGNGIPVLANLSNSLGYVALFNGASVGTTSPNINDTRTFNFTLATPQVISIGFLGNVVGNGNPGSYFTVKRIQLFSN